MRTGVRPGDPAAAASTAATTAAQVSGRQRMRPWYEEPVERATGESSMQQTVGGRQNGQSALLLQLFAIVVLHYNMVTTHNTFLYYNTA